MNELTSDQVVDVRGQCCPMPVIKTGNALKQMNPGQVLEVITTDPAARKDLPAWAEVTGNAFLGARDGEGAFHLFIRKLA